MNKVELIELIRNEENSGVEWSSSVTTSRQRSWPEKWRHS